MTTDRGSGSGRHRLGLLVAVAALCVVGASSGYTYGVLTDKENVTININGNASDATAPSISAENFSLTNPQHRDLNVTFTSDEQVTTMAVRINDSAGATVRRLSSDNFTESATANGTYIYTNVSSVNSDDTYEATLTAAEDSAGNDGAAGQVDTVTIDTTAPSISAENFSLTNPQHRDLNVTLTSDEQLTALAVTINDSAGTAVKTLAHEDFTESVTSDGYTYTNVSSVNSDDTYEATLTTAEGTAGNDGASGQTDTTTVSVDSPAVSNVALVDDIDEDGVVRDGDRIEITATVTHTDNIASVTANASQFDAGDSLTLSDDGPNSSSGDNQYSATAIVGSAATEGAQSVTVSATDVFGNDGAADSGPLTVDLTAPSISSFDVSNPAGQDVQVRFDSDEQLSVISVTLSGAESATLTQSDFNETDNGGSYTYEVTYAGSSDGDYTATLDTAADAAGNDGAGGQSDTVTVTSSA